MDNHEMGASSQRKGWKSEDFTTDNRMKVKAAKPGEGGRGGRQGIITFGANLGINSMKVPGNEGPSELQTGGFLENDAPIVSKP